LINNNSGVGTQILVTDINGDGKPDVLTSARKGTFVFLNSPR
jgi:FG-GAP repeat